jgi:hypothetical protein
MRRSITRLPWRQCSWRSFTLAPCFHMPASPATNEAASSPPPSAPRSSDERKALVDAVSSHQIPEAPSILSTLPPDLVETTTKATDRVIGSPKPEEWRPGKALPGGYNQEMYRMCAGLAQEGRNPSPTDLDQLFRLMWHDSPYGELKEEAMSVFRTMQKEGIVPTKDGFRPLFSVRPICSPFPQVCELQANWNR